MIQMAKDNEKKKERTDSEIVSSLTELYNLCISYYTKEHRKIKLLDATDRGDLWKALNAKFPPYQILPDTNHVAYIKANLLASLYTVIKAASIQPTSESDKEICTNINIALDRIWDLCDVGYYQFMAGDRAALTNYGVTQVGWSEELKGGCNDSFYKGNVVLKNIDPLKFMRDPFAPDLQSAGYCMLHDSFHKSVFTSNPNYKEKFKEYEAKNNGIAPDPLPTINDAKPAGAAKDYYNLGIFWVKEDGKINEYHTVNHDTILFKKEGIQPNEFPFAELYCNLPAGTIMGTSEPAKIFANSVAYNLLDSIALTAIYKNQRPPKFINAQSGLNVAAFAKHGDEADRTFLVNGDPSRSVYYHQFPEPSMVLPNLKTGLQYNIQDITGVDGKYTGRDTGSIITTGGTMEMLNRVTLIDSPKIVNYERYTKQLTKLILYNFIHHAPKRKYYYKEPNKTTYKSVEIDFPSIDDDTLFHYAIDIGSEMPKNKQRTADMANMLMEKQMQYQKEGDSVMLITEEEWLMYQDLPNKEFMLERMGMQRQTDALQESAQVLFQYAQLVKSGVAPDQAMEMVAESLQQKRMGMSPQTSAVPGTDLMTGQVPGVQSNSQMAPMSPMMPGGGAQMTPGLGI